MADKLTKFVTIALKIAEVAPTLTVTEVLENAETILKVTARGAVLPKTRAKKPPVATE
jgi:hypothetical protein